MKPEFLSPELSVLPVDELPRVTLSQSIIKKLQEPEFCAAKYKAYNIDQLFQPQTTGAQLKGQYFEYRALGSPDRHGNIPELPKLRNGKMSADEDRIIQQAIKFKEILLGYGMTVVEKNIPVTYEYNELLTLTGIIDCLIYYQGEPVILDLKLTANINSTWGKFGWGNYWNMNHLQAYLYMDLLQKLTGRQYRFMYAVFDYKPNPEYKFIEIENSNLHQLEVSEQIREAYEKLAGFYQSGFKPTPSYDECKDCQAVCPVRQLVKTIETFN